MLNKSNIKLKLNELFFKSESRKREESKTKINYPKSLYYPGGSRLNAIEAYFYEWSDVTGVPKRFYILGGLEDFLKSCGIFLKGYERDVISNCMRAYISCYKGSKELCIRTSYKALSDAMKARETNVDNTGRTGTNDSAYVASGGHKMPTTYVRQGSLLVPSGYSKNDTRMPAARSENWIS